MSNSLDHVIAATTQWLVTAFPATGGAHAKALARQQARQAVTVAAWLRYPTATDAELLDLLPPSGSWWLDDLPAGAEPAPWRTWVDDTVASWAAALLTDRELALQACVAIADCEHTSGLPMQFRRLTHPDHIDSAAAALLRHPDLLAPLANRHRADLEGAVAATRLP
ncbi:MAG TPA: hypothetical protein VF218_04700 [Acidothermaceae bacterium]|jgi:hypothetical protein